jgi:hypothetical protein
MVPAMGAVAVAILVPGEITIVAGDRNSFHRSLWEVIKPVSIMQTVRLEPLGARVHDAVTVDIPHITRLNPVHSVRNGLAIGSLALVEGHGSGGFDDGCERADWILFNVDNIRIVAHPSSTAVGTLTAKVLRASNQWMTVSYP